MDLELVDYTIPLSYRLLRICVGPLPVVPFSTLGNVLTMVLASLTLQLASLWCPTLSRITGWSSFLVKHAVILLYLFVLTGMGLRKGLKQ